MELAAFLFSVCIVPLYTAWLYPVLVVIRVWEDEGCPQCRLQAIVTFVVSWFRAWIIFWGGEAVARTSAKRQHLEHEFQLTQIYPSRGIKIKHAQTRRARWISRRISLLTSRSWSSSLAECILVLVGIFSCLKIDERRARERELAKCDENRRA